jgi:hypothetical protein
MSYGDDEHPISFRFHVTQADSHVHVDVWAGLDGMRGNCGTLTMRREDWVVLREVLGASQPDPHLLAVFQEAIPAWVRANPEAIGADAHTRAVLSATKVVHLDPTPVVIEEPSEEDG